jgi:hypothetical protein
VIGKRYEWEEGVGAYEKDRCFTEIWVANQRDVGLIKEMDA